VQVLSREDVQQALRHALKLQAGRHTLTTASTVPAATAGSSSGNDGDCNCSSQSGGLSGDGAGQQKLSTEPTVAPGIGPSDGPTEPTELIAGTTTCTPTSTAVEASTSTSKQIVLSQWALDTAFSAALRVPTPRLGRPAARSKEEIAALVTDKHEKSLIGNVISPQDIGVTYDMIGTHQTCGCVGCWWMRRVFRCCYSKRCTMVCINRAQSGLSSVLTPHLLSICVCVLELLSIAVLTGGLDDVKEMLRQCITYPLKYPRLYQVSDAHWLHRGVMSTYAVCDLITLSALYPAVRIFRCCVGVTLRCAVTERLAFMCCLF
jgi:hypothetical protein